MDSQADKLLFTIDETCRDLGGMSRTKVYDLVRSGDLTMVKIGRRSYITAESRFRLAAQGA